MASGFGREPCRQAPVVERGLAAILALDMIGYSRLMEADEIGTLAGFDRDRHLLTVEI